MNIVVMGAQWGDEGKGKIVDYLASGAEYVVRYAGGANAGHTIVVGSQEYALHLVPSGILYPNKKVFLGMGMVIDPKALFSELDMLKKRGIDWEGRVFISDRAHIVLPSYARLDKEMDAKRVHPIGTTGRGIGIAYSKKSQRDGIRLADITWQEKLDELEKEDKDFLQEYTQQLLQMKCDITSTMANIGKNNILLEGAQGAMLDLDSGTYPYVSSGLSCSAGAAVGAGIGPGKLDKVLGVFKAYSTRVGNGPLPTEFNEKSAGEICEYVRKTGREYGVTTGRPRRCGYLDLVALKYAVRANAIDSLVLTHLDIYDTFDEIQACTQYDINGKKTTDFPANIGELEATKPVLQKFKGWKTSLKNCKSYDAMPQNAKAYIEFIENYTGCKVSIISVGYKRDETFVRQEPWK